jgi:S1/P1 Nuclease
LRREENTMALRCGGWAFFAFFCAAPAFGWGDKGHRIHAGLTWKLLSPTTRERVEALLGDESFATAALWADAIRKDRKDTAPWHYVNIEKGATGFEASRDCKDSQCVVTQIEHWTVKLSDPTTPRAERLEALKWVLHLVADLHQPLHVALAADRGGNDIPVRFFGEDTNLHSVWDVALLERFGHSVERHVDEIAAVLDQSDVAAWRGGSVVAWADESWRLAHSVAYAGVDGKEIAPGAALGRDYWLTRAAAVDRQLGKAAVRLAAVLERAFSKG